MKSIVYYDGHCPICSREIKLLQQRQKHIEFLDVHLHQTVNRARFLKQLHVLHPDGSWQVGFDANVYMWQGTLVGYFWKFISLRPMRWLAESGYNLWAKRRYRKRYQCGQYCMGGEDDYAA